MAAQKGASLLIKRGDAASPEAFTTVAGLRTKTMTINQETVDVTNSDSNERWRELLADAGVRSLTVSGSGVFTGSTVEGNVRSDMMASTGALVNYQVVVPGLGTFEGAFDITTLEYAGEYNGEVTHSLTLESGGQITFQAE